MKFILFAGLVLAALGAWWYFELSPNNTSEPVACTADAMQCPDGTWVGRTGPNCEFVCPPSATTSVSLYYYNPALDQGPGGAQCSSAGLVAVSREVPSNITVIEVVDLLLKGELTEGERAQGIETEYPLEGLDLTSAVQESEVLTLTFADPQQETSGGACRTGVLWLQIEATAKAFSGASTVRFMPEELFQP